MAKSTDESVSLSERTLDARPDTVDFRDRMYVPALVEVPPRVDLDEYRRWGVPILDQGTEGACTGFGLTTVAHYLLRRRNRAPDIGRVSPRMFYEMAKRYDEWEGEDYEGSSARGAMKGWHKHGVCRYDLWPYNPRQPDRRLTNERATDATNRPLGAYFRVNHQDLVAMHSAITEVGILYVTATVHQGWDEVGSDGMIPQRQEVEGGHAFAIVAYDERGFWLQNSWSERWGLQGLAHISYDDWLENGTDVWAARLGAPVRLRSPEGSAQSRRAESGAVYEAFAAHDLRPHIISVGNDGLLKPSGTYGTSAEDVASIFNDDIPRITGPWRRKRILMYMHGGLTSEESAVQRVADYRAALLGAEVYPLALIWHTDFWTTLQNILQDALRQRRPEGILGAAQDFMLDRLDDALEPLARNLGGKAQWDEMKENAVQATTSAKGGARIALNHLARLVEDDSKVEVHVIGFSAGAVLAGPLIQLLTSAGRIGAGPMKGAKGLNIKAATCTLWAPACTVDFFKETYLPAVRRKRIGHFSLFTLTDDAEQDDHCANIYHKSLLYLVSNAFENVPRIPLLRPEGTPILGMQKFIEQDQTIVDLFDQKNHEWVLAPNTDPDPDHSTAKHHGDFDDDEQTLRATLARILRIRDFEMRVDFRRSASARRDRRLMLS